MGSLRNRPNQLDQRWHRSVHCCFLLFLFLFLGFCSQAIQYFYSELFLSTLLEFLRVQLADSRAASAAPSGRS